MRIARPDQDPIRFTVLVGLSLTLAVVLLQQINLLDPIERRLHDRRAADCQFFMPPPTDRLVHVDIDDESLDIIGRWPWPRQRVAMVLDEINRAGAKVIALDIVFAEPQAAESIRTPDGRWTSIDHDKALAESMRRGGNVIAPIAFGIPSARRDAVDEALDALHTSDLEISYEDAHAALQKSAALPTGENLDRHRFITAKRHAMSAAILRELQRDPTLGEDELRSRLLPRTPEHTINATTRALSDLLPKAQSFLALRKFSVPVPENAALLPVMGRNPPIPPFASAAAGTGFVDFVEDPDGVARRVPLWVTHSDKAYTQLGLALACAYLGVNASDIKLTRSGMTIPMPGGGERHVPLITAPVPGLGEADMFAFLPWFGHKDAWWTMYDRNGKESGSQHLPMTYIWDVHVLGERLATNSAQADEAIRAVLTFAGPSLLERFQSQPIPPDAVADRARWIDDTLRESQFMTAVIAGMTPADIDTEVAAAGEAERQRLLSLFGQNESVAIEPLVQKAKDLVRHRIETYTPSVASLPEFRKQILALQEQIVDRRRALEIKMRDRAVLIGLTATATGDYVPTSLHTRCPGVVCHGVVFNSILTGEVWRTVPGWVDGLLVLALGLLATLFAAFTSPGRSLLCAAGLMLAYWAFNGVVLFDYGNTVAGVAGPMLAVILVWSGGTLTRFVIERAERQRIRSRFASYVDPVLVDYVLEKRDHARFDGEKRELTVVFTDLEGFTQLSERLEEETVPLLNDYMERMVPIIRRHGGYVNKFLGDGIMFFHGAPRENAEHARDAVETVLEMQLAITPFNEDLKKRGLPTVAMRCGVNSGQMIVGDAGPSDASDYTVLGDAVNLAARLESANKATGTRILIGRRTAELLGDRYLLRPVGKLRVVGRVQDVMTYDPLCLHSQASEEQVLLANMSRDVVDAFVAGRFAECELAIKRCVERFGEHKLMAVYAGLCREYMATPPGGAFSGCLVLDSK